MTIIEIFKLLEGKEVSYKIDNNKLYPFIEYPFIINKYGSDNYYSLRKDGDLVAVVSIKDVRDFTVTYKEDKIWRIAFKNEEIVIK